jgi:hypothetical protein
MPAETREAVIDSELITHAREIATIIPALGFYSSRRTRRKPSNESVETIRG